MNFIDIQPKFISFEGTEGVGKTTAIDNLCAYFDEQKIRYIRTREPGGSVFAEQLRLLLLDKNNNMATECELLLLFAARSEHIQKTILPALHDNYWVICDRFVDSTVAYQGFGRYLGDKHYLAKIDTLTQAFVPILPHKTIWLDLDIRLGIQRATIRSQQDRFESESVAFFERVYQGFVYQQDRHRERICRLDAKGVPGDITKRIIDVLGLGDKNLALMPT